LKSKSNNSSNKVFGIVVSYNPDKELYTNLEKLTRQVSKIIIFDNKSSGVSASYIRQCETIDKVEVIYSDINIGLSKAQNKAISQALSEGAEWILTLDDDSQISDFYVQNMLELFNTSCCDIGAIVPKVTDVNSNQESRYVLSGKNFAKVLPTDKPMRILVAIASGMLINRKVFDDVGFMNEDYFIDYIDIDFSLRINRKYHILLCPNATLYHKLGNKKNISVLGANVVVSNHSPFRRYHIYRNRIDIWKRYFSIYPKYICYEICVSLGEALKILIFEDNRKDNFLAIYKGISSSFKKAG